jgi:hypothetical protein
LPPPITRTSTMRVLEEKKILYCFFGLFTKTQIKRQRIGP